MQIRILSAKLLAASSEYPRLGSRRAWKNCLDNQEISHHKHLKHNEKHRRILPQEPTALSLARRVSANPFGFEPLGSCRSEAETGAADTSGGLRDEHGLGGRHSRHRQSHQPQKHPRDHRLEDVRLTFGREVDRLRVEAPSMLKMPASLQQCSSLPMR